MSSWLPTEQQQQTIIRSSAVRSEVAGLRSQGGVELINWGRDRVGLQVAPSRFQGHSAGDLDIHWALASISQFFCLQ